MGLQLDFYFTAADFKEILCNSNNAKSVKVSVSSIISGYPETAVMTFKAAVYDDNEALVGNEIDGCPSPCHPNDSAASAGEKKLC